MNTLTTACPMCGWTSGLVFDPTTRKQTCTTGCSNSWLTPEAIKDRERSEKAIARARARRHRRLLRSVVGASVRQVSINSLGGSLAFTFSNGVRISFSDSWHQISLGDEHYSGSA